MDWSVAIKKPKRHLLLPQPQEQPQPPPVQTAPAKPKITKLDDLPRHTYPVQGSVVDIVTAPDKFASFAAAVRADVEKDLATYDIEDKTTLKRLKGTLLTLDLLDGKNDEARKLIAELRDLEDKPAEKLMTGFIAEARLDVQDQLKQTDLSNPEFQTAFQKELTDRTNKLPWAIVQDDLKHAKGSFEIVSRNLVIGQLESEIDPIVKQTGSLSGDVADGVIQARSTLETTIPLNQPVVAALSSVIQAHSAVKADIWKDREVTLTKDSKAKPVVIGIWDSGVDPKVYPKQLFTDETIPPGSFSEQPDYHGLAFDLHSNPTHGELYPMGDNVKRLPDLKSQIKGILDLTSSVDSPEATALKGKLATLSKDQVKPLLEDLGLFGNYIHGTHVAGIATEGNPFARILIARLTFDYHLIPEKPTMELAQKGVVAYNTYIAYFKQHGVRVVNMSWGGSLKDVEEALEKNGVGNADERKKQARELFDIDKNGLFAALQSAPDILFVTAAGNSDNDVKFDEVIPSSFVLPNIMTVGAVDQAGDETSFTSFGKNVSAYANGFEVESFIPGGSRLKLSGTSMASPEVTNLAAKLFALDPSLTPSEVIDLIKIGLEPAQNNPKILLINPKASVETLEARLAD